MTLTLTFDDILAAQERLKGHIERTPCRPSRTLSEITGADVWVKFENLQFTAAYKERGALNKLLQLSETEKKRGVIAASAGNHSQGLAYHAARLGIPVTIVMPRGTPFVKVQQTRSHRAEGIAVKQVGDLSYAVARPLVDEVLLVEEPFFERAIALYCNVEKTVTEGAGAGSLAALLAFPERFRGKSCGLVITGGNIDTRLLASVLTRELVRDHRLVSLR